MKLVDITDKLQALAHEGKALYEVIFCYDRKIKEPISVKADDKKKIITVKYR